MATKQAPDTINISRRKFTLGVGATAIALSTFGVYEVLTSVPDTTDEPSPLPQTNMGSSIAIVAAELVERELSRGFYSLTNISPFPTLNINYDSFQIGVLNACGKVVKAMRDHTLNKGFASNEDHDLHNAASYFDYKNEERMPRPRTPLFLKMDFKNGCNHLRNYNSGVLSKNSRPPDQERLLRSMSCYAFDDMHFFHKQLARAVETGPTISTMHQELYYETRGAVYAYHALFRGAEVDCAPVVQRLFKPGPENCFYTALDSMRPICQKRGTPLVVLNGSEDSLLVKTSDLKTLADDIKTVRANMRELADRTGLRAAPFVP